MPKIMVRAAGLLAVSAAAQADVVTQWHDVYIETVRAVGGAPCPMTRTAAMMYTSMYDAVNSIERTHEPYLVSLDAPAGTSAEAAAAAAAHRVLSHVHPDRAAIYNAELAVSLAKVPDGSGEANGILLGRAVADAIIADRADDGTQTSPGYQYGTAPGDYRPTYPDYTSPPVTPGWGNSRPWTMPDPLQFQPVGPLGYSDMASLLASDQYAREVEAVRILGSRGSDVRTPYDTETAFFWAVDANGTMKPPGQLNIITAGIAEERDLSLAERVRLFALVNLALADSGLACWYSKFDTQMDLWRPITAIREADTDGNPRTHPDPDWIPLAPTTPAFPSYTAGHASFAGAHAAVMIAFFGTDQVTFTAFSDDPGYTGGPRTYHSFWDAAVENALSRVYLGVHYLCDSIDGLTLGQRVGEHVMANTLLPACRADFNGDDQLTLVDFVEFRNAYEAGLAAADLTGDGVLTLHDWRQFRNMYTAGCP